MAYIPDPTNVNQPDPNTVKAATAAVEFQALKLYLRDTILAGGISLKANKKDTVLTGSGTGENFIFTTSLRAPTLPLTVADNQVATMAALASATMSASITGAGSAEGQEITSDGVNPVWGISAASAIGLLANMFGFSF